MHYHSTMPSVHSCMLSGYQINQVMLPVQGKNVDMAIDWLVLAGDYYLDRFAVKAEQFILRKVPRLSEHPKGELLSKR